MKKKEVRAATVISIKCVATNFETRNKGLEPQGAEKKAYTAQEKLPRKTPFCLHL